MCLYFEAYLRFIYFLYFFRRKRFDGLPRFFGRNSSSGWVLDEGSLFSESDWLIATSAVSSLLFLIRLWPKPEELASSEAEGSPLSVDGFEMPSASVRNTGGWGRYWLQHSSINMSSNEHLTFVVAFTGNVVFPWAADLSSGAPLRRGGGGSGGFVGKVRRSSFNVLIYWVVIAVLWS